MSGLDDLVGGDVIGPADDAPSRWSSPLLAAAFCTLIAGAASFLWSGPVAMGLGYALSGPVTFVLVALFRRVVTSGPASSSDDLAHRLAIAAVTMAVIVTAIHAARIAWALA